MTGLGVERTPRTAHPLPSTPPSGVSASLPPHIQWAERRMERHGRRTGSRWSLRVLVVGGLAGAAWLLTGAAAHAADRVGEPSGSLLGTVVGSEATAPVSGLLNAAVQPLEAAHPAHHEHHVVADLLEVPQRVLTRPVETLDEIAHGHTGTPVDAALGDVDQVLGEAAAQARPTGGPAPAPPRIATVALDATRTASPPAERPRQEPAETPVAATSRGITPAFRAPVAVPPGSSDGAEKQRRPPAGAPVKHVKAGSARAVHRQDAVSVATAEVPTVSEGTPRGDTPADGQLHLGMVSGTPTTGSGTPTEGGSAAVLPAAIADGTMARHRLPIASDVEVRRYDAEAPTVSPD